MTHNTVLFVSVGYSENEHVRVRLSPEEYIRYFLSYSPVQRRRTFTTVLEPNKNTKASRQHLNFVYENDLRQIRFDYDHLLRHTIASHVRKTMPYCRHCLIKLLKYGLSQHSIAILGLNIK